MKKCMSKIVGPREEDGQLQDGKIADIGVGLE